jgi:hypothetical protein
MLSIPNYAKRNNELLKTPDGFYLIAYFYVRAC